MFSSMSLWTRRTWRSTTTLRRSQAMASAAAVEAGGEGTAEGFGACVPLRQVPGFFGPSFEAFWRTSRGPGAPPRGWRIVAFALLSLSLAARAVVALMPRLLVLSDLFLTMAPFLCCAVLMRLDLATKAAFLGPPVPAALPFTACFWWLKCLCAELFGFSGLITFCVTFFLRLGTCFASGKSTGCQWDATCRCRLLSCASVSVERTIQSG
mmetsp:Transcript_32380/g.68094  ORF Transcript_32380/g.68094 Transcript_32380/m.68094 type:complete len:210 (+) Transcript_32380:1195-1824(+)